MENFKSLQEVRDLLHSRKISLTGIVTHYLENIEKQKNLNAFLEVYAQEALDQAEIIQKKLDEGSAGKLAGMVVSIKDMICFKDHKISASSHILDNFTSLYSSTVVERILAEDAIIIGRTSCDEFAMGASNETSFYGPVKNAFDPTKVSGGSSGGSAVSVQAGMCLASLGTDTGGSVRQPASFCGIVGMKPTYGRISRYGIIAYASSFDQVGLLTNTVKDAALLLEVIAGKDEFDGTAIQNEVPEYSQNLSTNEKYRFAVLRETLESEGLDPEIKAQLEKTIEQLKNDGHSIELVNFNLLEYVVPTYYILTTAEASSNLARYDGVHFGYRSKNATDLETTYKKSRTEGFGTEVKRRIMLGTFVLSAGYYDAYYTKAQKVRRLIRDSTIKILTEYDFILLPTAPTTAFAIGEKIDDPIVMYLADIFTVQASLSGLPAISLPLGKHSNGLPFGLQLIANKLEEQKLLNFSASLVLTNNNS